MFWQKFLYVCKDENLRNRILFIIFIFAIYRFLANIPLPTFDQFTLDSLTNSASGGFFQFLNILSGGGFSNFSIVLLGLAPYISTAIVMQLLTATTPSLKKYFFEEGEDGRKKFYQYISYITVPVAIIQSYGFLRLFQSQGLIQSDIPNSTLILTILLITTGVVILMWMGSLISKFGIGNGISLLIFAGIVSVLPGQVSSIYQTYFQGGIDASIIPVLLAFIFVLFIVIFCVIFILEGERRVPIYNTRMSRSSGSKFGSVSNYLPIKLAIAGVIPIIFAFYIVSFFPQMILLISNLISDTSGGALATFINVFNTSSILYGSALFALVFLFTYITIFVYFQPGQISDNFKKTGTFIEGVRPGEETENYLRTIILRLTFFGALFLSLIAVFPIIIQYFTNIQYLAIGGASILIAVSVIIDLIKKLDAQIVLYDY